MEIYGFTLVELMVVMAIIAILVILIIGGITMARRTSTQTIHRSNARNIGMALDRELLNNNTIPQMNWLTFAQLVGPPGADPALGLLQGDVTIQTTSCSSGGGYVYSLGKGYWIVPSSYDCTNMNSSNYIVFPEPGYTPS